MSETEANLYYPLDCLDVTPGITLEVYPCEDCPVPPEECRALGVSRLVLEQQGTIVDLKEENIQLQEENAQLLLRLFNVRFDLIIDEVITREGLRDHLRYDEVIQEELKEMNWGVLRLDGRFVNYINRYGHHIGDAFIQQGGNRIVSVIDGLGRSGKDRRVGDEPYEDEDRRVRREDQREALQDNDDMLTIPGDIVVRKGAGDEFLVFVRNITPEQLARLAARIQAPLTVDSALNRYEEGKIPFVASVGYAHAQERDLRAEVLGELMKEEPDYYAAVERVGEVADDMEISVKADQYKQMWYKVKDLIPEDEPSLGRSEERRIAEEFLKRLCEDFWANPQPYIYETE